MNRQYNNILLTNITDNYSPDIFYFNLVECTAGWERDLSEVVYKVNSDSVSYGIQKTL